jgi:hypothetical protein
MSKHIYKSNGPPSTKPYQIGHHWIDTVAKETYISVGTSSVADWAKLNEVSVMPIIKSGKLLNSDFTGTPKKASVVFASPFSDTNYSVSFSGTDGRIFTIDTDSQTVDGFIVNTNADLALVNNVLWIATQNGDFV